MIHHTGGQTQTGPSLCSRSLLFICLSLYTLSNQRAGYERSRSPPLWSPRGITGVPQSPSGAQPPVSLAQSGNVLRDVKLHHHEAERLAGFHGAFVDNQAARSQPTHLTASIPLPVTPCYICGTRGLSQRGARLLRRSTFSRYGVQVKHNLLQTYPAPRGQHAGPERRACQHTQVSTPSAGDLTAHRQDPTPNRALGTTRARAAQPGTSRGPPARLPLPHCRSQSCKPASPFRDTLQLTKVQEILSSQTT